MKNDVEAEKCIIEACRSLTEIQTPLNSKTVPNKAIAIFSEKIAHNNASERIYNQINTMIINGKLKSSAIDTHTWCLSTCINQN